LLPVAVLNASVVPFDENAAMPYSSLSSARFPTNVESCPPI